MNQRAYSTPVTVTLDIADCLLMSSACEVMAENIGDPDRAAQLLRISHIIDESVKRALTERGEVE